MSAVFINSLRREVLCVKINVAKIINDLFEMYKKSRKGKFIRAIVWFLLTLGGTIMASPFFIGLWDVVLSALNIVDDITGSTNKDNNTLTHKIFTVVTGLSLVCLALLVLFKTRDKETVKKKNMLQINHSSLEFAVYNNMEDEFSEYNLDVITLNQTEEMKTLSITNLQHALREQDKIVGRTLSRLNNVPDMEIAYLGLAHIPLVMLMGYQIADKAKCKFFEWNQNNLSWTGLPEKSNYPPLLVEREDTIQSIEETTEVTVRIGITGPIPKTDLNGLNLEHLNAYYMHLKEPERNIVKSVDQINDYQKKFRLLLDELNQRYPNLKKIHLFYYGQTSLAYRLGSAISSRMDREICIYNNVKSANPQYKWALTLGKVGEDYSPKINEEGMTANV